MSSKAASDNTGRSNFFKARLLVTIAYGSLVIALARVAAILVTFAVAGAGGLAFYMLLETALVLLASLLLVFFARKVTSPDATSLGKGAVLLAAAAVLLVIAFVKSHHVLAGMTYIEQNQLFVELRNTSMMEQNPVRGLKRYAIDDFGFRKTPGTSIAHDGTKVMLVGDSFIFGSGVEDDEHLAAVLNNKFSSAENGNVQFVSAGVNGANIITFHKQIAYGVERYAPDLVVLLIQDQDFYFSSRNSRLLDLKRSLIKKLLFAMNLEIALEVFQGIVQIKKGCLPSIDVKSALDRLKDSAGEARLMIVTTFSNEIRREIAAWIEARPEVGWFDLRCDPKWEAITTIPNDGHWDAEGSELVASILMTPIKRALTDRDGLHSLRPLKSCVSPLVEEGKEREVKAPPDLRFLASEEIAVTVSKDALTTLTVKSENGETLEVKAMWSSQSTACFLRVEALCFVLTNNSKPKHALEQTFKSLIRKHRNEIENLHETQ